MLYLHGTQTNGWHGRFSFTKDLLFLLLLVKLKYMLLLVKKQDCQAVFRANTYYVLTRSMQYLLYCVGKVWTYQRCNQKPYIEERQTTQWLKDKKYKQLSTDKDCTLNPLKNGGEFGCSGRACSSYSTSDTRRYCSFYFNAAVDLFYVILVKYFIDIEQLFPVISHIINVFF